MVGEKPYMQPVRSLTKGNQIDKLRGMLDGPSNIKGLPADSIPVCALTHGLR